MRVLWVALALLLAGCAEDAAPVAESDGFDDQFEEDLQATADTGVIRCVVVDDAITPIMGVLVTVQGAGINTTTNVNGLCGFQGLDPGSYFLEASKPGYESVQTSAQVVAGEASPAVVRILMARAPGTEPFVSPTNLNGFLTCGVAVFATSLGCTTFPFVASAIGDQSVFRHEFSGTPSHSQGELVWESTQPAAGAFIWEITDRDNTHIGYRETTTSPALAYINQTVLEENPQDILTDGVDYRFFGGPHELCRLPEPVPRPDEAPVWYSFGCGATVQQAVEIFIHDFYNFTPDEGWRFTEDGAHPVP